jgi:hypothetical protein
MSGHARFRGQSRFIYRKGSWGVILFSATRSSVKLHTMLLIGLFLGSANSVNAHPDSCFITSKLGRYRLMTYIGDRKCVALEPPRTISGIWINEFEGSSFHENIKRLREVRLGAESSNERVWLTIDNETLISPELKRRPSGRAYRIKFIGRNASDMRRKSGDGYGHLGGSSGLVLVDRVIDWKDIGPANPRRR